MQFGAKCDCTSAQGALSLGRIEVTHVSYSLTFSGFQGVALSFQPWLFLLWQHFITLLILGVPAPGREPSCCRQGRVHHLPWQ